MWAPESDIARRQEVREYGEAETRLFASSLHKGVELDGHPGIALDGTDGLALEGQSHTLR